MQSMTHQTDLRGQSGLEGIAGFSEQPLWDTFEVSVFFLTGTTMGIVLGFLIPSLWRGFRRRFRPLRKFTLNDRDFEILPLKPEIALENATKDLVDAPYTDPQNSAELERLFVYARALFQSGYARESVQSYLKILRSPVLSSRQSARLYAELAQVYGALGLFDRALALAKEYQTMRPSSAAALSLRTSLANKAKNSHDHVHAIQIFNGLIPEQLAMQLTHELCAQCETLLHDAQFKRHLRHIDELLKAASQLAPGSLRLRHTRALRSFTETKARSADKADELWITFYGELQKRDQLAQSNGLAIEPALDSFVAVLALLSATEDPIAAFHEAKNQIESAESTLNSAQGSLLEQLGCHLILLFYAQPHFSRDIKLQKLLDLCFPRQWQWFQSLLSNEKNSLFPDKSCIQAFSIAMNTNCCSTCGARQASFFWQCPSCLSRETSKPLEHFKAVPDLHK